MYRSLASDTKTTTVLVGPVESHEVFRAAEPVPTPPSPFPPEPPPRPPEPPQPPPEPIPDPTRPPPPPPVRL